MLRNPGWIYPALPKEKAVFADASHRGDDKRVPPKPGRRGWITARRSTRKAIEDEPRCGRMEAPARAKAAIRATVEHPGW
jgi:IS5 family transposase